MSYKFVRTIAQDKDGFMWFGSSEGLARFDGYKFLSFHHDSEDPNSLTSDVISRILIDRQQRLWVGTFGSGLNLYKEKNQDFVHFTTKKNERKISNDTINVLFEDSEGKIWVGTENGLNILELGGGNWRARWIKQELGNPRSLGHNTVHSIIEVSDKQIWVGTNGGGISVLDINGNFIRSIRYNDVGASDYLNKFVNYLYVDNKEMIWIGTVENGLLKFNPKTKAFSHYEYDGTDPYSILSNTIETIYQDSSNKIWIGTDKGLLIYNEAEDNFWPYKHTPSNPYSLSNDFVMTFFEDKNKVMWIGTFTGVNLWDPNTTTFQQYSTQTNPGLKNNNITSFAQFDDSSVYFSTYSGGIYQLFTKDNKISPVAFSQYFSDYRVMSLLADGNTLWVGTRASGLFAVDLASQNILEYRNDEQDPNSISANSITDIIKDKSGNIWVSTFHQGINKLNNDRSFTRYIQNVAFPEQGPSSNHVLQLLEDDQGYLWLATYGGGVNRLEPESKKFIHLRHDENDPNGLSSNLAWIMLLDKDKNIWIGTQASGLNILSRENRYQQKFVFSHLGAKDGMKSLAIYGILQDFNDQIWLSTSKGISRYSPKNKRFTHFDLTHGLIDLEYTHSSVFSGMDNTLYFGAGKGFSSVNPQTISSNKVVPEIRLINILNLIQQTGWNFPIYDLWSLKVYEIHCLLNCPLPRRSTWW